MSVHIPSDRTDVPRSPGLCRRTSNLETIQPGVLCQDSKKFQALDWMFHISYMQGFPESCEIIPSFLLYRIIEIFRVLHTFRRKERAGRKWGKKGRKAHWGLERVMDFWSNCEVLIFILFQIRRWKVTKMLQRQYGITQFIAYFQIKSVLVNHKKYTGCFLKGLVSTLCCITAIISHFISEKVHPKCPWVFFFLISNNQSTSSEILGWRKHKLESRLPGEISITSDMQMTPPLWQKVKRN